jgi:hypothetical protein
MTGNKHHPIDTSCLTDADWTNLNKMRHVYSEGGKEALKAAMLDLSESDLVSYTRVIGAYFPNELRNALKDAMAESGMTLDDLKEMNRKKESGSGKLQ